MAIHPVAEAAFLFAVVLAAAGSLVWLVKRWRDVRAEDTPAASDLLTNFRELHSQGGLSDEEYRTIKTTLAGQLRDGVRVEDLPLTMEALLAEAKRDQSGSSVAGDAGHGAL